MQAVEVLKTGAVITVPILIDEITNLALRKLCAPSGYQFYIRGFIITVSSIGLIQLSQKGLFTFPLGIYGLYLQYHGLKSIEYILTLNHGLENLERWIQRLNHLDKHSRAMQIFKFSHSFKPSSLILIRREIDKLLVDKIHNHARLIELIREFEIKLLKLESIRQPPEGHNAGN